LLKINMLNGAGDGYCTGDGSHSGWEGSKYSYLSYRSKVDMVGLIERPMVFRMVYMVVAVETWQMATADTCDKAQASEFGAMPGQRGSTA
jgi:hypothetical protein